MPLRRLLACVVGLLLVGAAQPVAFAQQAEPAQAARAVGTPLTFTTWNIGPGTAADLAVLISRSDAVALQEAGTSHPMIDRTLPGYWAKCRGSIPNTTLVYNTRTLARISCVDVFLSPRTYVGPDGAGPTTLIEKRLVGGHFVHRATGRRLNLGSVHYAPSQYIPIRRRLALQQAARTAAWVDGQYGLTMVGGDYNTDPSSSVLDALRNVPMVNDHDVLGKLPTFVDGRTLDHVWYVPRPLRMRLESHATIRNQSDHRALATRFMLSPR